MPATALRTSAPLSVTVSSSTPSSSKTGETTMLDVHTEKAADRHRSTENRPEVLAGAIVLGIAAQAVLGPIAGLLGAAAGAFVAHALTAANARRPSSNGSNPVNR